MNKFQVKSEHAAAFEQRWRDRESFLSEFEGFVRFWLLRSDDAEGFTEFVSHSQWLSREYFQKWVDSDRSRQAHAKAPAGPVSMKDMLNGPPQFKGYELVLDQVPADRVDARSIYMDQKVEKFFAHETAQQREIVAENAKFDMPPIAIGAFEGRLLEVLLRAAQCKKGVEIGTLGGYSTSWLCRAVGPRGFVYSCELDAQRAQKATENLNRAGFEGVFKVLAGPALESLKGLAQEGPFDFVFIDADKSNYPQYCEWAVNNLRPGGLILCDNAYIWGGMNHFAIADATTVPASPHKGLHAYSKAQFGAMTETWLYLAEHPKLSSLILPTGDGLAISVKTN